MIRTALILDEGYLTSVSDQAKEIMDLLESIGLDCELIAQGRGIHLVKDKAIDLLILDYGGAAALGSMDMMQWQLEEVRKFAEDHPSTLLIVWTSHTSRYYQEVNKAMPDLPNVLLKFGDTWYEQGVPVVQKWFQVNVA